MIRDLILAGCATLLMGTASLQIGEYLERPARDIFSMAGVVLALAAGPFILAVRKRKPIIPIASIYCVVMFLALLLVDFVIDWHRGRVEL